MAISRCAKVASFSAGAVTAAIRCNLTLFPIFAAPLIQCSPTPSSIRLPRHYRSGFTTAPMTMKAITSEESGSDPMIHRYESPFNTSNDHCDRIPSALIVLNTPIKASWVDDRLSGVLGVLWEVSECRVCADGGANRLYDATVAHLGEGGGADGAKYLPDVITGDLDSLRPDVRQYYEERGVSIIRVEDQNFHDLDKSFMAVQCWIVDNDKRSANNRAIKTRTFVYGGFGGRFDQEMGVINALCVWGKRNSFEQNMIAAYNEETCAFVLPKLPMRNEICIKFPGESSREQAANEVGEGPTCGLIPIFGRCENVKTTGLKWNLSGDTSLEFGGLVSSSNHVLDKVVTVETSTPMLFTSEMIVD